MPFGIVINSLCVFFGGLLGCLLAKHLPASLKEALPSVFGLSGAALSITLIIGVDNLMFVTLSLILGTVIGELLAIDRRVRGMVGTLQTKLPHSNADEETMQTTLTLIVLFCFSASGLLGAMIEGFSGNIDVLLTKSVLDFFTAAIFATTVGILVPFIAVPQFLILLLFFLAAKSVMPLITDSMIANFRACGGIINFAAVMNLLKLKQMKPINMLPALLLVLLLTGIVG